MKIEGDKHRIQQVIDNVINNSVKYTGENENIDIYLWEEGSTKEIIKIQDDGIVM